ncbi:hypothetical protein L7F22_018742 [Adiantum nelumboides]|nr:hypothetical protein [Adiantum nelumboides]
MDKVLAFIQQFDATFGDEGFTESSKLHHVAMHFQKSARQWWASLRANSGEAPKTWKALRASIMNQFLASEAKDKVLTKWRSLKLTPYESIDKYVNKFWDLHLKDTVHKKIDFEVVGYFTASWCGPCKFIAPVFLELSEKNRNLVFLKVNVDEVNASHVDIEEEEEEEDEDDGEEDDDEGGGFLGTCPSTLGASPLASSADLGNSSKDPPGDQEIEANNESMLSGFEHDSTSLGFASLQRDVFSNANEDDSEASLSMMETNDASMLSGFEHDNTSSSFASLGCVVFSDIDEDD